MPLDVPTYEDSFDLEFGLQYYSGSFSCDLGPAQVCCDISPRAWNVRARGKSKKLNTAKIWWPKISDMRLGFDSNLDG